MAKSQRLRLKELRALYLLVGECRELGADPIAWRMHMQQGLCELLDGQITVYTESACVAPPGTKDWLRRDIHLDYGFPTDSDRAAMMRLYENDSPMIEGSAFTEEFAANPAPVHVVRRQTNVPDRDWYNGFFFNEYIQPAHQDDALILRLRRGNEIHLLVIQREIGAPRFERRQVRLGKLFALEWANSFGTTLAPRDGFSLRDIPPRLREVLACLMQGDSEKQAALRLNISQHTLHDYVKQLHQRCGVQNRGQLLARCRPFWRELSQPPDEESRHHAE